MPIPSLFHRKPVRSPPELQKYLTADSVSVQHITPEIFSFDSDSFILKTFPTVIHFIKEQFPFRYAKQPTRKRILMKRESFCFLHTEGWLICSEVLSAERKIEFTKSLMQSQIVLPHKSIVSESVKRTFLDKKKNCILFRILFCTDIEWDIER